MSIPKGSLAEERRKGGGRGGEKERVAKNYKRGGFHTVHVCMAGVCR
jgi:hypothetical protein